MNLILIGLAASRASLGGGLLAFRFQDRLHLVLGFSAGAVLGLVFFDLMPEVLELSPAPEQGLLWVFIAFLLYMVLDRSLFFHHHTDDHCHNAEHQSIKRGRFGVTSLSIHSFLDGAAVGLAFQSSAALGVAVALAVLAHGFSDGINAVSVIRRHGGGKKEALKWLAVDAAAPLLGVISTFFFILPEASLSYVLALFAGFFLYLGASDLLPESHHGHKTHWTTIATLVGAGLIWLIVDILTVLG